MELLPLLVLYFDIHPRQYIHAGEASPILQFININPVVTIERSTGGNARVARRKTPETEKTPPSSSSKLWTFLPFPKREGESGGGLRLGTNDSLKRD